MDDLLNTFQEVRECDYKGEHYSVRDNGAIMRHPKPGKNPRPMDNVWTFGKRDDKTAYMLWGAHRVHIIVAYAFLGERDSSVYVVDHIDTNRCNNRVENLRWFTRLENALNNPITRKRIEWLCGGDIQKFIDDPSCLRTEDPKARDLSWMRTVTPEEAKTAMSNLMRWAKKTPVRNPETDATGTNVQKKDPEWMFKKRTMWQQREAHHNYPDPHIAYCIGVEQQCAYPEWAIQYNWDPPTSFPLCPASFSENAIDEYANALSKGAVFSENKNGKSTIIDFRKDPHRGGFVVLLETNDHRPFVVIRVMATDASIVHENYAGIYKTLEEAQNRFEEELKWPNESDLSYARVGNQIAAKVEKVAAGKSVEFLLEPTSETATLEDYFSALTNGKEFSRTRWGINNVIQAVMSADKSIIGVAVTVPSGLKHFAAYKITHEGGAFRHEFLHTCFTEDGALQRMTEAAGLKWEGADSIDNYC